MLDRLGIARAFTLFTHGDFSVGVIVNKTFETGEHNFYHLEYEFVPISADLSKLPVHKGSDTVSEAQWQSIRIGGRLTVLYPPRKPHRNVPYPFGSYRF